ncbi:MAG: SDR family oxidoreductase [Candidatus Micrarchaeota archaeon]|nr:SDR family oxidoreductase [Candidatus Micrarchaeota archaeon]
MKILVTGGLGFIGQVLVSKLLDEGYTVKILDKGFFGARANFDVEIIKSDTRTFEPSILRGVDTVIDLAAISQPDPSKILEPLKFYEINFLGSFRVAALSKKMEVKRYIFPSTCSVYGFQKGILSEESQPNPIEPYAETKLQAEKFILPLSSKDFCVTVFRIATAYGLSPKMRFDLVVNGMTLSLFKNKKIRVMRDGDQIRPVVHVKDIATAMILAIESEEEIINGQIFNLGSNEQNYKIIDLAKIIGETIGEYEIEWYGDPDKRSYHVKFDKISNILGFKAKYTPKDGAKEIYSALESGKISDMPQTNVIGWYKMLQEINVL